MDGPPVRLRVLGPARLDGDPLPSRRQRRILAALAAARGSPVPSDTLVDVAWGERPPAHPAAALRTQLSRLRALLAAAGGALPTERGGYRLAIPAGAVDAWRFEDLLDAAGSVAVLSEALALWTGNAYADADDHPAVAPAAARLAERHRRAVEDAALAHLDAGAPDRAAEVIAPLLVTDPLRERARAIELRGLVALGRAGEALTRYQEHRRLLAEELGMDPSPMLQRLQRDILDQHLEVSPAAGVLPALPASSFVGRDLVLDELTGLLRRARVVTVLGPGGVGKTRLALHACHAVRDGYEDGVWWCDLAPTRPGGVGTAVAARLGLAERACETVADRVAAFLGHRRALLVLDNCEHVVAEVAGLVDAVLVAGDGVDVLATSRGPLGVDGEHRLRLAPLAADSATSPAVRLFLDRAHAAAPGFEQATPATVALCRSVGGLPLALELAGACMTRIDPRALADRVGGHLGLLDRPGPGPADRHRSLLTVLESSYHLLAADERALLGELSVFAGPFPLDVVEALAGGHAAKPLGSLVDNSLVLFRGDGRYELLPLVWGFAAGLLVHSGHQKRCRARHAEIVVRRAAEIDARLRTSEARLARSAFDDDIAELRVAREWLLHDGDVDRLGELSACTHWFAMLRTRMEFNRWAEDAVGLLAQRVPDHPRLGQLRACAAMGAVKRGDLARARATAQAAGPGDRFCVEILAQVDLFEGRLADAAERARRAAALHREAGDEVWAINAASVEPAALAYAGELDAAAELARGLVTRADEFGVPSQRAMTTYILAETVDDAAVAMTGYERAIGLAREVDAEFVIGLATTSLAARELRTGRHHKARRRLGEAIDLWQRAGVWNQSWLAVRLLVESLHRDGEHEAVAVLSGAGAASPHAGPAFGDDATRLAEALAAAERALGPVGYERAWARGTALGDDAAIAHARELANPVNQRGRPRPAR